MKHIADIIAQAEAALGAVGPEREAEWREQAAADERYERVQQRSQAIAPLRARLTTLMQRAITEAPESLQDTRALATVRRWLDKPDAACVLVLSGTTGCGKTVAAAYALAERRGQFVQSATLCRNAFASFGDERAEYERALGTGALLVVDDVGAEMLEPGRVSPVLVEVLEKRQSVRTLITTNLTRADFAARYGDERLVSRLARVAWVTCTGDDLRKAKP